MSGFRGEKPLLRMKKDKKKGFKGFSLSAGRQGFKEASEMLKNYKELIETRRGGPLWSPIKGARRGAPLRYLSGPWKRNLEPVNPCLPAGRLESLDPRILFAKDFVWKTEF